MVNIFETREITINRTFKAELQRISDWRKGIAIARYYTSSIKPSRQYYLIDKNYNYLYSNNSWKEDEIEGEQIERVFGGYYIIRDAKCKCVATYPGQDRDTEYSYQTYIKDIIDENGCILSSDEKKRFLESQQIKYVTEYGEGIVECGSFFYELDNYECLFKIEKKLVPIGIFKDGKCKVGILSDYRDFIVFVKDNEIVKVYDEKDYLFFKEVFGVECQTIQTKAIDEELYYPEELPNNSDVVVEHFKPIVEYEINRYEPIWPRHPKRFLGDDKSSGVKRVLDTSWGIMRWKSMSYKDEFYNVDGKWIEISKEDSQNVFDKIFEIKCNRPNFIKEIVCVERDLSLESGIFSIYKFECRPYGYLRKDGVLEYDFDVNNIIW
jgi:hypothetical protein